jgi:RNA polymerase sigma factor (sigma-70 family)
MTASQPGLILRHLRRQFAARHTAEISDGQLLERFVSQHEEAAFATLVSRHGPMVLSVCQRVLGNWHDAEDAFQAAFLTLAQKAATVRQQTTVGSWMYQVAFRIAIHLRQRTKKRQQREEHACPRPACDPLDEVTGRELLAVFDEEVQHLPARYRAPLVLCCLEGQTRDVAARQLGYSVNTLNRRLERARQLLRTRLARRGLAPSAALLTVGLPQVTATASVPAPLVRATLQSCCGWLSGESTTAGVATQLARETLRTLAPVRLKAKVALLLAVGLLALGVGVAACPFALPQQQPDKPGAAPPAPDKKEPVAQRGPLALEDEKEITVTGRVVDEHDKPVPTARVALAHSLNGQTVHGEPRLRVLATEGVDEKGTLRLRARMVPPGRLTSMIVLAAAPGHGLASAWFDAPGDQKDVVLKLLPEVILKRRLIDLQGAAAAGATCRVHDCMGDSKLGRSSLFWQADGELPFWPKTLTADKDGWVTVRGFGPGQEVGLDVRDDRFGPGLVWLSSDMDGKVKEEPAVLQPAQTFEGRVIAEGTGKPLAKTRLAIVSYHDGKNYVSFVPRPGEPTDADGRFRVTGYPSERFTVQVFGPEGQPYLGVRKEVAWPRGAVKHEIEIALPRGMLVRGKVTEESSGRPIAGARIIYHPRGSNTISLPAVEDPLPPEILSYEHSLVRSGADGTFQITVPKFPGHLLVMGPSPHYLTRPVGNNELYFGKPGGFARFYHGVVPLNPKDGVDKEVSVTLRRGVTLRGQVVGPDGKPVPEGIVIGGGLLAPFQDDFPAEHETTSRDHRFHDGRFELPGCEPDKTYRLLFLSGSASAGGLGFRGSLDARAGLNWYHDIPDRLGAVAEVSVKDKQDEPLVIRLATCGSVTARLLDGDGKPITKPGDWLQLVVTPGLPLAEALGKGVLAGEVIDVSGPYDENGKALTRIDNQGHITLTGLIPGAIYQVQYDSKPILSFRAEAGKSVELGDLKVGGR